MPVIVSVVYSNLNQTEDCIMLLCCSVLCSISDNMYNTYYIVNIFMLCNIRVTVCVYVCFTAFSLVFIKYYCTIDLVTWFNLTNYCNLAHSMGP